MNELQPEKRTVMFVDDEQDLLMSLRASLRRERRKWDMRFISCATEAIESLRKRPAEIVVTDMQMPGMDGAEFLEHVRREVPASARIVLSGQADQATTMRAVRNAHQWLAKPTDRDTLASVIQDALTTLDLVSRGPAHDLVTGISGLPLLPRVFHELSEAVARPDVALEDVARIIASDPAAASRTLQLANSAFFGLPRPMSDIGEAVTFLGLGTISRLVLGTEVMYAFGPEVDVGLFEMLTRRAKAVSMVATRLGPQNRNQGTIMTAGLVHLIGVLLLCQVEGSGGEYAALVGELDTHSLIELETRIFNTNHTEVGAALLSIWGVPHDLSDAVGRHAQAVPGPRGLQDPALALGTARRIVELELTLPLEGAAGAPPAADERLVELVGGDAAMARLAQFAQRALGSKNHDTEAA